MNPRNAFPPLVLLGSLALALPSAAAPQIGLDAKSVYPGVVPFAVLDYDGDGVDELVGATSPGFGVAAYSVPLGGPLVLKKLLVDQDTGLRSVALADIDGDGLADLVGVRQSIGGVVDIVVHYDRGGNQFESASVALSNVDDLDGLRATDYDLDGDVDIVLYPASRDLAAGPSAGGSIMLALNVGGGAFAPLTNVQSFIEPLRSATPMELDQDGDLDFAALRNGSGTLVLARRQGTVLQIEAIASSPVNYQDLAVGDVDGDGLEDVVALRQDAIGNPVDIDLYTGNVAGGLTGPTSILSAAVDLVPDVSLLDIDGDGDLDVAITGTGMTQTDHQMRVLVGDGLGGFTPRGLSGSGVGMAAQRLLVGDFNGDSQGDVFGLSTAGEPNTRIVATVRLGQAGPDFGPAIEFDDLGLDVTAATGDCDGDGIQDVLSGANGELYWFRATIDQGRFEEPLLVGEAVEAVLAGNFDTDAADEILVRTQTGYGMIDSLGAGVFGPVVPIDLGSHIGNSPIRAADLDGDGDLDFVVTVITGAMRLTWVSNLGNMQFAAPSPVALQGPLFGTTFNVGDFNGDGVTDVQALIFNFPGFAQLTQVRHEGLGGGQFGPQQVIGLFNVSGIVLDIDEDGYDDALWPEWTSIRLTRGGPTAPPPSDGDVLVVSLTYQVPLGTADFDGDGLKDLLAYREGGEVVGYSRLPGSTLAFDQNATPIVEPTLDAFGVPLPNVKVQLVDLGGDGDLDIMVSSAGTSPRWFENDGHGFTGMTFCGPGALNSTGIPGRMLAAGTPDVSANELTLRAVDLPRDSFGFFIASQTQAPATPVPSSAGLICLGGSIGRYVGPGQIQSSGANGSFSLALDVTAIPTPLGPVTATPGASWSFQAWHRDSSPVGPTSNFTDGLEIVFE